MLSNEKYSKFNYTSFVLKSKDILLPFMLYFYLMEFSDVLTYIQIFLTILMVVLVLIQKSEASVGGAFGGGESEAGFNKRRGSDLIVFITTIVIAILWVVSVVVSIFI